MLKMGLKPSRTLSKVGCRPPPAKYKKQMKIKVESLVPHRKGHEEQAKDRRRQPEAIS